MENLNDIGKNANTLGLPKGDQLAMLLENLFELGRLADLAHRCSAEPAPGRDG